MQSFGVVIVAAGKGSRMKSAESKQYLPIGGKPILVHTLELFEQLPEAVSIVLVVQAGEEERCRHYLEAYSLRKVTAVIPGGDERQASVLCGLQALPADTRWVLVHDAVRPFAEPEHILACLRRAEETGAAVLAVPVKDTVKLVSASGIIESTPERSRLWAVQTPQAFAYGKLLAAHKRAEQEGFLGTDDAMLMERYGTQVRIEPGSYDNIKITTPEDLEWAEGCLMRRRRSNQQEGGEQMLRVGQGFDVHAFAEGRKCIIGGVDIPYERGLLGHSDADVLLHAITDAILGALALGDIGKHFPDTDAAFKDADSLKLLQEVWALVKERGYRLGNLDATIIAQRPKMAPYIPQMAAVIAGALEAKPDQINVKATTTEKLGFTGREEGIAAQAVVCLLRNMLS